LREYLGELETGFDGYPLGELSAALLFWRTEINANWKVIKDASGGLAYSNPAPRDNSKRVF
jgi:hypothetical protein